MTVSVIIPVGGNDDKNRVENFGYVLDSLTTQTTKDLEIVVVEQELTEKHERELFYQDKRINKYFNIRSQVHPTEFNYAWCANVGGRRAKGDLLMFLASDLILDSEYIENVQKFSDDKNVPFFMPWSRIYRFNMEGYEYWKQNKVIDDRLRSHEFSFRINDKKDYLYPSKEGAAGGPVITRKFWDEKFFGYNESFFGWGCEDNEALWRLIKLNKDVMPVMDRWMYHLPHSKKSGNAQFNRKKYVEYVYDIDRTIERIAEKKDELGDLDGPRFIKVGDNPVLFYFNWNVGSGIERTGNTVLKCIEDRYPVVYKSQNPPCIISKELARQKPEIILINENYPRIFEAVYHYKVYNPKTKIIFLNHCYDFLVGFPHKDDENIERLHRDGTVLINYLFLNNKMVNHIINLNYMPKDKELNNNLKHIITERYHPIDDKFALSVPFSERPNDFFYYGNVLPHKFSLEFAETLKITKMNVHMFCNPNKTEDKQYIDRLTSNSNLIWKGRIEEDRLVPTLNKYRFFVCPHSGHEPFNLAIAEAIRCGCIPLITNDRNKPGADWIDWANGCYIEYNNPHEMLEEMSIYMSRKNEKKFIESLEKSSKIASEKMIELTSESKFKELLSQLLDN